MSRGTLNTTLAPSKPPRLTMMRLLSYRTRSQAANTIAPCGAVLGSLRWPGML